MNQKRWDWDDFETYHCANPHVYEAFVKYTFELRNAGAQHYSIHGIGHIARYHWTLENRTLDRYKINSKSLCFYGRLIMTNYPELQICKCHQKTSEGFFFMRESYTNVLFVQLAPLYHESDED